MTRLFSVASAVVIAVLVAACGAPATPASADDVAQLAASAAENAEGGAATQAGAGDTVAVVQTDAGPMKVMMVMDSSGSMWGQIGGTSKRDIARKAVRDMIAKNPALDAAGLIAYGHRRQGDCSDIELLREPGAAVSLPDAVDALVPVGKTPLTAAVIEASEIMKIEESRATVILVTDGIETCNADPCATGADLEARGIDFTAHVIGFGLSDIEGRQVACLAEQTGGQYYAASNAGELATALETLAASVETGPPEAATATATIKGPAKVEIGAVFPVAWTGPGGANDYIDLVPVGYTKVSGELSYAYTRKPGEPANLRAPGQPGKYQLRYVWIAPQGRTVIANVPIEIIDAAVALSSPARVGIGQTFDVVWRGPAGQSDYIDIVPRGVTKTSGELTYSYARSGSPAEFKAPGEPGAYDIRYIIEASNGRSILKTLPIDVEAITVGLSFNPSASLGGELEVDWSGPGTSGDYVDIVPRGETKTNGELSYAYTRSGNPVTLRLPGQAGEYDVRYVLQAPGGKKLLRVAPLKLEDVAVTVSPAKTTGVVGETIEVSWTGPGGASDYIDIVPRGTTSTNGELSYAYARNGNPLNIVLPADPGDYDMRYVLGASNGKSVKVVVPVSTTAATVTLSFPAKVKADADFSVKWTGPGHSGDYVDIVKAGHSGFSGEADYAYTRSGETLGLTAPKEPGSYTVRYVLKGPNGLREAKTAPLTVE